MSQRESGKGAVPLAIRPWAAIHVTRESSRKSKRFSARVALVVFQTKTSFSGLLRVRCFCLISAGN
jgi:hypothetical protein